MKITSLDMPIAVNQLSAIREELPEAIPTVDLLPGLKAWDNPINRFRVLRLHRSADPRKRTQQWIDQTRAGLSTSDWLREYELIWEALDGRPVYADEWGAEFHSSRTPLGWNPAFVVCRGWDFGLYPACVFTQLFPHSRLMVLREAVGIDIDTERFAYEVNRLSSEWFPNATFVEFVDPSGKGRAGTDGRSYTNILSKRPLRAKRIVRGAISIVARRTAVVDFLKDNVKGSPCLLVDPSCEYLLKGFNGGYMYAFNNGTLKVTPEKNIFSHIHDALQYVCSKVLSTDLRQQPATSKPLEPSFGRKAPEVRASA